MTGAAAGILKIIIFLVLGFILRKTGVLKSRDVDGIKKIILNLALPALLFLSFSKLDFSLKLIPVIAVVFAINFIAFWIGVFLNKTLLKKSRIIPLCISTINFGLVGMPLYEAIFGIENLNHYAKLGVGNELFAWFVFYFLFRWHLTKGTSGKGLDLSVLKAPVIWGLVLGCLFSILGIDMASGSNFAVFGVYRSIEGLSGLASPLILIYVGYNISISGAYLRQSLKITLTRFIVMMTTGYSLKALVLDRFIEPTVYSNAAFFLLITLPAIFSIPILAADYLEEDEVVTVNNTLVLHTLLTIIIFAVYTIIFIV